MTKRPEALLLLIGVVALAIAGALLLTHQAVPDFLTTVVLATLVGGGVAINPQTPNLPELEKVVATIKQHGLSLLDALEDTKDIVTSVTPASPATIPPATPAAAVSTDPVDVGS